MKKNIMYRYDDQDYISKVILYLKNMYGEKSSTKLITKLLLKDYTRNTEEK